MNVEGQKIGYILIGIAVILSITTFFVKAEMDAQEEFMCILIEQDPDVTMEDCPAHTASHTWLLSISFGVAVALLIGGIYLVMPKPAEKKRKKVDVSKLSEDEAKIYNILVGGESFYQSDLIKETGYSKVKVTRILDRLEQKDIVERKRRGMTNIIFLK